jgi:phage baseplate assembly protein W
MLPDFGTPLRSLLFEPNDPTTEIQAREMIINSITKWEPRITIKSIVVSAGGGGLDTGTDSDHVLGIVIEFFNPGKIADVQELRLEIPINN